MYLLEGDLELFLTECSLVNELRAGLKKNEEINNIYTHTNNDMCSYSDMM